MKLLRIAARIGLFTAGLSSLGFALQSLSTPTEPHAAKVHNEAKYHYMRGVSPNGHGHLLEY